MSSFLAFGKDYVASNYEKTGNPVYLHIQQMKKPIPEIRPLKKPTLLAIALKLNPSLGEFIASCLSRIWKRNLGRDDRCISDHGKEARFPFLDEDVIKSLLELPLWEIAELDEPAGRGKHKQNLLDTWLNFYISCDMLQDCLALKEHLFYPKEPFRFNELAISNIQFGSRIARESNRKTFGSNRVENQASAGSVEIWEK
ncbi:uncharacterized protein A4U43_C01F18610 [Asparagus officinalis]|uniref:Ubiquitinyl hydrolase variant UBP zinc finger domain-containing protein n=1 Tax=Asparagus officinalis TaxID=4686 RepID=A0A5P1FUZ6_ASPOF|nr:uncharacterized protein A4U43_C01F18610 [Asparagus officinalis]